MKIYNHPEFEVVSLFEREIETLLTASAEAQNSNVLNYADILNRDYE